MKEKNITLWISRSVLVFLIVYFLYGLIGIDSDNVGADEEVNLTYPLPWSVARTSQSKTISAALIQSGLSGCGEFYIRESMVDRGEVLVACRDNEMRWYYYLVWVNLGEAEPYAISGITPPG